MQAFFLSSWTRSLPEANQLVEAVDSVRRASSFIPDVSLVIQKLPFFNGPNHAESSHHLLETGPIGLVQEPMGIRMPSFKYRFSD
jgi:hypothetical protein